MIMVYFYMHLLLPNTFPGDLYHYRHLYHRCHCYSLRHHFDDVVSKGPNCFAISNWEWLSIKSWSETTCLDYITGVGTYTDLTFANRSPIFRSLSVDNNTIRYSINISFIYRFSALPE